MLNKKFRSAIEKKLNEKKLDGTYKSERTISSAQNAEIHVQGLDEPVLNFCSNNYLGLSDHHEVKAAAKRAIDQYGFGLSSVRFICGTQTIHKALELNLSRFLETEDTILYNSCFDANGGLFQSLLSSDDTIISASLNHASIIDGVRLSSAKRLVYRYDDMSDLEQKLKQSTESGFTLVVTDGVFSMEGELAPLDKIADLCHQYNAMLMVDDSHATGFIGDTGKGTAEFFGVQDRIDIYSGTLGKALGGATGGYISGSKILIDWLRNSSRPYLFSNSLTPGLVAGALKSLEIVQGIEGHELRRASRDNTRYFRESMTQIGFDIKPSIHPIVPIMVSEATIAAEMSNDLLKEGIYVIGFSYPVVPKGEARIRVQISAIHTKDQLDRAIIAFQKLGKQYGILL